ncbi:response regulator [Parachitinimonas caeni]|uniref:Response regulator n=1 Tax=Parachitinimonas caeni TaxID=3031301 RepID=A0ABT7E271_9NEIS|nr:response regulator [Parachitinimonas caeni]MDK2126407.1 response regulator [Parachitinimonas caeni]
MHILMIEDDLDLGLALQRALKTEGFTTEWWRRIADAPALPRASDYDCILLDLSLPDGTGFSLLRQWRQAGVTVPILIMTALSALDDRLAGLDGGADDFVVKPFAVAELVSRIRAVSRRYAQQASEVWALGDLEIEPRRHLLRIAGEAVELSLREFRLLLELAREPGNVVPKGILAQRLEPLGDPVNFGAIDVHVCNLRAKIGAERIRTVRGVGYLLVV